MSTILVVDDKDRVAERIRLALGDVDVSINCVADARSAKQLLLQDEITLLIADVDLGADPRAGLTLCRQLREHDRFSGIPVILVSESLEKELIQEASDSKAQGLVGWPFPLDSIKKRLLTLLNQKAMSGQSPQRSMQEALEAASSNGQAVTAETPPQPAVAKAATPVVSAEKPSMPPASDEGASIEEKLKSAQHLLAMVLHNLKTSNLLDLVEIEDIPSVVLQMARTVCGESSDVEKKSEEKATKGSDQEVSMDLDSVFGIKK